MLSADADVFVPRWSADAADIGMALSDEPTQCKEASQEIIEVPPGLYGSADELCSTYVPTDLSDELDTTHSPFWDLQESPFWEAEPIDCGMLPDPSLDYMDAGPCGDTTFGVWPDPTACCGEEEAGMDTGLVDVDDIAAAAMMSMCSWGPGLAAPPCLGLEDPDSCSMPPQGLFVSSCALARQLAPRPENAGDRPMLIQTPGGALDGLSTLEPAAPVDEDLPEADWSYLPERGSKDYAQKVSISEGCFTNLHSANPVSWLLDRPLPSPCRRPRAESGPAIGTAIVGSGGGRERDIIAEAFPEDLPAPLGGVSKDPFRDIIAETFPVDGVALGTFDGFLFSKPAVAGPVVEEAPDDSREPAISDGRTYAEI